ncbi:hypothetical protein BC833DRAFT_612493 [Globomyces pollinis-pini]|nr:hypothetical protein BC833DRAFT_612493 [Globomyces pollinis-pini]
MAKTVVKLRKSYWVISIGMIAASLMLSMYFFVSKSVYRSVDTTLSQFSNAKVDYFIGASSFEYRMTQSSNSASSTLPTQWTEVYFDEYCDSIRYGTRLSNGEVIDQFFCTKIYWSVKWWILGSILCQAAALVLTIILGIVWYRFEKHFCKYLLCARCWLSVGIAFAVKGHLLLHTIAVGLLYLFVFQDYIKFPHSVSFDWGLLIPTIGVFVDLKFLFLFYLLRKNMYIHIILPDAETGIDSDKSVV